MKSKYKILYLSIAASLLPVSTTFSDEYSNKLEVMKIRNTSLYLIKKLVEQGVLTKQQAISLVKESEAAAIKDVKKLNQQDKSKQVENNKLEKVHEIEPGTIRIPLIPEIVKQEISEKLSNKVREAVTSDVLAKAKQERWGIPGVLPGWVDRIKITGDIRLRGQSDIFDGNNTNPIESGFGYFDYQAVNTAGGNTAAGDKVFINTYENRDRLRVRARLGIKGKITQGWKAGMRLATGNFTDPVSTNQTLGNSNRNSRLVLERAYVNYESEFGDFKWSGGRIPNPWLSTNLVWDKDLNFDGMAFKFHLNKSENPLEIDEETAFDSFFTLGTFPLAEQNRYNDKWLFGAQIGFHYEFTNTSRLSMALAYYDYQDIEARRNAINSTTNNHTVPDYVQQGNSMFNINQTGGEKYGLATDYNLLNFTVMYDMADFAPTHIYLTADIVKNIGYEITNDARLSDPNTVGASGYQEQTEGYQIRVDVGWPDYTVRGNWRAYFSYKKLERDAVVDAYTDSDFHLGGTDAEGYTLGFNYGIDENVWLSTKWISTDVIDGIQFGPGGQYRVNTVQLDLNAKF